jgi:hypothetical protein
MVGRRSLRIPGPSLQFLPLVTLKTPPPEGGGFIVRDELRTEVLRTSRLESKTLPKCSHRSNSNSQTTTIHGSALQATDRRQQFLKDSPDGEGFRPIVVTINPGSRSMIAGWARKGSKGPKYRPAGEKSGLHLFRMKQPPLALYCGKATVCNPLQQNATLFRRFLRTLGVAIMTIVCN